MYPKETDKKLFTVENLETELQPYMEHFGSDVIAKRATFVRSFTDDESEYVLAVSDGYLKPIT